MATETLTAPVETVTVIGPSEALRLGRLTRPRHVTARIFDGDDGACALGAMLAGVGLPPHHMDRWLERHGLTWQPIASRFDFAEYTGRDGDAVVLAYLAKRGL